ncbi:hypothetical protein CBL_07385 [Carabus blaptoides fortunei]
MFFYVPDENRRSGYSCAATSWRRDLFLPANRHRNSPLARRECNREAGTKQDFLHCISVHVPIDGATYTVPMVECHIADVTPALIGYSSARGTSDDARLLFTLPGSERE